MENLYCTIFIVDVSQNPEEVENVTSRIVQLIEDHGGLIKRNEPWGKRRLAYPIRKRTNGFYVEIEFSAQSRLNIPQIIESEYRINDRVLRYLTYVVTKEELRQRELSASRAQYYHEEEELDLETEDESPHDVEKMEFPDEKKLNKQFERAPVTESEPVAGETASEEESVSREESVSKEESVSEEENQKEKTE